MTPNRVTNYIDLPTYNIPLQIDTIQTDKVLGKIIQLNNYSVYFNGKPPILDCTILNAITMRCNVILQRQWPSVFVCPVLCPVLGLLINVNKSLAIIYLSFWLFFLYSPILILILYCWH